jgi:hypothetical protein
MSDVDNDRFSKNEGSFEDLYRDSNRESRPLNDLIQKERAEEPPKREAPKKKGKSFVELLTGDEDIGSFARQLNLDPEMSEKLLVPLLSLLDKYNVGENVTANPRTESMFNALEIIKDVAPVVRGAAEFVSGKKAELEADDMAYLEQIRQSQSVTDASLFDDDEELFLVSDEEPEPVVQQPIPQAPAPAFDTFGANDWGNFFSDATGYQEKDPLDNALTRELENLNDSVNAWASQQTAGIQTKEKEQEYTNEVPSLGDMTTGLPNTITDMMNTEFAIIDINQLAKESGVSVNDVYEADSQRKINGQEEDFEPEPFDLSDLQPEESEFEVDYTIVPDDAEEYDPFTVAGFDIPSFDATDIEEIEEAKEE